jgi:predicted DNA-binding transcriptional regulator AlpA
MSHTERFLRLPEVLRMVGMRKSQWYKGIAKGEYPRAMKLSTRMSAWRESDIQSFIKAKVSQFHADGAQN